MDYLYHGAPDNLKGNMLFPLNELKDIFPEIYTENVKKYVGREEIMSQKVPYLNCLWNDVLHLSAVHPAEIKAELARHGKEIKHNRFFQIDPFSLESEKTIIYLYRHTRQEEKLNKDNFALYNPHEVSKYRVFPDETKKYYEEVLSVGDRPLLWHRVPHFLYRGRIDISGVGILDV